MSDSENEKIRVYLLGDSITQGLGSKKVNFEGELAKLLGDGCEIINLAYTGTTVDYALGLLDEGKVVPIEGQRTVCVVLYGNVDAQIRPNRTGRIFPHIPKRYKGGGMLMPRPFYSRAFRKNLGQHVDNAFRSFFSALIKAVDGTEQWVHIGPFSDMYVELVDRLQKLGTEVVCCSCVYIDERLFPGSMEQYELYNEEIAAVAASHDALSLSLYSALRGRVESDGWDCVYNKDHFHPNGEGYLLMAEEIAKVLTGSVDLCKKKDSDDER